jgi:UDP-N-acetylmuramoylalanine--D-glutamate ligase
VKDLVLRGSHNLQNALASSLIGVAIGIPPKKIKEALKSFSPIAHRLEFVAEIEKVSYYNDSAATTPEATIAAVNSFSNPIVLICGGADKKLELSGMAREISQNNLVEKIVLLGGTATEELENFIKQEGGWEKVAGTFDDFESAIEMASQIACEGYLVLLSPGCASFGMFANEFARGDQFREIVKKMTAQS